MSEWGRDDDESTLGIVAICANCEEPILTTEKARDTSAGLMHADCADYCEIERSLNPEPPTP